MTSADGDRVTAAVLRLVDGLHQSGVTCSTSETLDGLTALTVVDIGERALVRVALHTTLIKRPEDTATFDILFDRFFPLTPATPPASTELSAESAEPDERARAPVERGGDDTASPSPPDHVRELAEQLRDADTAQLAELARALVARHGAISTARASERHILRRVLTAIDLANVLLEALRAARRSDPEADSLAVRQRRDDMQHRIDMLKRLLAQEIRASLFADVGTTGVGLIAPRRIEDAEILKSTAAERRQMREAVRPLARKLAHRLARLRIDRHRGRVDIRRTTRRSIGFGGVPMEIATTRRRRHKHTVVVLCDISGSVAEFAHFTLSLLTALSDELRSLRSFVFVDGTAEITEILRTATAGLDPRLLLTLPGVVVNDGHSDYDAAFRRFLERHSDALDPTTTVIIAGDARTNYRTSGSDVLRDIARRSRSVYWFNPEPQENWGTHDSSVSHFREHCDEMFEVRTLRQLAEAVARIL
jgi:uncharacterized protein